MRVLCLPDLSSGSSSRLGLYIPSVLPLSTSAKRAKTSTKPLHRSSDSVAVLV